MKIQTIPLNQLPVSKLKGLCLSNGMMEAFIFHDYKELDGTAFLLYNRLKLIGWCYVYSEDVESAYNVFGVFIAPEHRRKGWGSKLYKEAQKKYSKLLTCPHDYISDKFFEKVEK